MNQLDEKCDTSALGCLVGWADFYRCPKAVRNVIPAVQGGRGAINPSHQALDIHGSIKAILAVVGPGIWANSRPFENPLFFHPLERAIQCRLPDLVKAMLDAGFSASLEPTRRGRRLLLSSAMQGRRIDYEIIHMLLDRNSTLTHGLVDEHTPLKLLDCSGCMAGLPDAWQRRVFWANEDLAVAHRIAQRCLHSVAIHPLLFHYRDRGRLDIARLLWNQHTLDTDTTLEKGGSSRQGS